MAAIGSTTEELRTVLNAHEVPEEVMQALGHPPFKVTTLRQFANFFGNRNEVKVLFLDQTKWKDDGMVKANLTMAYREADMIIERSLRRAGEGLPDENMEDPLRAEVGNSLMSTWRKTYHIQLPTAWQTSAPLLGRFHREFQKQVHVLFHIKKIRTLEATMSLVPEAKRARLSHDIELRIPQAEGGSDWEITSALGYNFALKVYMYSLSLAGAYIVNEDDEPVLFAPLDPLVQHLAVAETYTLKHTSGIHKFNDAAVLHKLRTVDEAIRSEWARLTREQGFSLGKACKATKAFAASLWLMEPMRAPGPIYDNTKGAGKKGGGKGGQQDSQMVLWQPPALQDKGGGKGNKGDGKGGKQNTQPRWKLVGVDPSTKVPLCKGFNSAAGCSTAQCRKVHRCDIQLPNGNACASWTHNRVQHTGPKVEA